MIKECITTILWKPVKASRPGPAISHLFFVDDLLLFSEASTTQIIIMRECLDDFCLLAGQKVNYDKSIIYCSPAHYIVVLSGSPLVDDLGTYLGVPLIHSGTTSSTYNYVLDKVQQRLTAWKQRTLSLAGRITYVKSVKNAIPVYTMQTILLPKAICTKLDQIMRDVLWGGTSNMTAPHLVNWTTVCTPKDLGGLGIKDKIKWIWRFWPNWVGISLILAAHYGALLSKANTNHIVILCKPSIEHITVCHLHGERSWQEPGC